MAADEKPIPSIREALESAMKDDAAAGPAEHEAPAESVENDSKTVSHETATGDDRPRGPDGKFIAKSADATETPAAEQSAPETAPTAAAPASNPLEAPQHWSQADKDWFNKLPTPEMRAKWLEKSKSLESGYNAKFQEVAPLRKVIEKHNPYLQSVGATAEQAFDYLINAERQLRLGSAEQKQQMLAQIAKDYGISLPTGAQAPAAQPAVPAEGEHWDPTVQALQQKLTALEQAETSRRNQFQAEQQQRVAAEIMSFANAKTEGGLPANPYFAEVADDIARLANADRLAGRTPVLKTLYDAAVWANPTTRARLIADQAAAEQRKRETDAKAKAEQARKASGSISGAPKGGNGVMSGSSGSLRGDLERAFGESAGRV